MYLAPFNWNNVISILILTASAFMQSPVGYEMAADGRAQMNDFLAIIQNPQLWVHPTYNYSGNCNWCILYCRCECMENNESTRN